MTTHSEQHPYPRPANDDNSEYAKMWRRGVWFRMEGGPMNGKNFHLTGHPLPDGQHGWDVLRFAGVDGGNTYNIIYKRPDDVDPTCRGRKKPTKSGAGMPVMRHVGS